MHHCSKYQPKTRGRAFLAFLHLSPLFRGNRSLLRCAFCGRESEGDPLLISPLFASQGGERKTRGARVPSVEHSCALFPVNAPDSSNAPPQMLHIGP